MSSPKSSVALKRLGHDLRSARLSRRIAVTDLAERAGTSASTIQRLEKGDAKVAVGTLADVLVTLGLVEKLADLVDVRKDDLGLALTSERTTQRGRSFAASLRRRKGTVEKAGRDEPSDVDPDGVAF
ncbi:helix-turn-helix domain-containing protein [Bradyrhizobium sp. Pha-3]|uniref:helix-turn-helix domain-containing protein n=1 Tax=Bradyrhizobium sp. Pha-3 TaxID=208375 RepID=UPI0035D48F39